MKKIIIVFAVILCVFPYVIVKAQNMCSINGKDITIGVESNSNVDLTELDNQDIDILLGYNSKLIADTYEYDIFGNLINVYEKEITEEELELLQSSSNYHVLEDGLIHDITLNSSPKSSHYHFYETTGKKIDISYYKNAANNYVIDLHNAWKINPTYRSHDIIAARWTTSKSTSDYTISGTQIAIGASTVNYTESLSSDHMKKYAYGAGISQNLYDNYAPSGNTFRAVSSTSFGTYVYGTYQHATQNISLANSKSYTISSSGLGGVLNHTYSSSYDGMDGIYSD